ncbi:hypothetical protein [Roseisolibacter agri]|uniref:Lipoprotein n=1 Tax=Roseisolibacter agri TaxID=2014610 RepID=A0AA37QIZ3_9BACT|nr:hypothetical protein [Roseisolibacter agri]GLC27738.1 hypothetical protein rosag_42510 [Roseisolibacter agri]
MSRAVARTLALAALLAGCQGSTGPEGETPATAFVSVQMLSPTRADTNGIASISGNVVAGRDARGALREVQSPLQVGGRAFTLGGPSDDFGTRHLQSVSVRLATVLGREPLAIEAPTVAGLTPNRPRVRITTVRALDAEMVRPDTDGGLRLHLAVAPGDDAAASRTWRLTIFGTQPLTYRGTGHPPAELVVPRELLPPATGAGQWRAELQVEESHGFTPGLPGAPVTIPPYDVRVVYTQMVLWTVNR